MSKTHFPKSYETSFNISPQIQTLIQQMGIENMRDTIDPEITNEEIDELLNKIEIESGRKKYLMEIVRSIIHTENITDPSQILNIKIQVLLDNLSKKLCRCTEKEKYTEGSVEADKIRSKEALCRHSIFHNRNIDYITHDCGEPPIDRMRYKYGMGPLLRPYLTSDSKILLRRYNKKDTKTLSEEQSKPMGGIAVSKTDTLPKSPEQSEPMGGIAVSKTDTLPKSPEQSKPMGGIVVSKKEQNVVKNCTVNSATGRCVLGEPNMIDKCQFNAETGRCRKI